MRRRFRQATTESRLETKRLSGKLQFVVGINKLKLIGLFGGLRLPQPNAYNVRPDCLNY
jgi:hypothetical protein